MKTKLTSIGLFVLFFYVLPLLPKQELLLSPQMGILVIICVIIFLTQPPIEVNLRNSRDKNSMWVILVAVALIQMEIILEWAYIRDNFLLFRWDAATLLGLGMLLGGTIFRVWAIRTLGKSFTATIQTQQGQQIITTGAYRYVRHPSYLGAYLAIVGSAVFMHTYFSIVFAAVVMFFAYLYRIVYEEQALAEDFGEAYINYQQKTKRMIPFIF